MAHEYDGQSTLKLLDELEAGVLRLAAAKKRQTKPRKQPKEKTPAGESTQPSEIPKAPKRPKRRALGRGLAQIRDLSSH